jgi:hypothetical protein
MTDKDLRIESAEPSPGYGTSHRWQAPNRTRHRITLVGAVATTAALFQGCRFTEPNPYHCFNNEGDAYCAELIDDGNRPYCQLGNDECITPDSGYGCVPERPADECYSPCGGRSTIDENGECLEVDTDGPSSSSSVSSPSTTSPETSLDDGSESSTTGPECTGSEDCPDPAAPICDLTIDQCMPCDAYEPAANTACAQRDPGFPLCVDGACVQCTAESPTACTGKTPVCDGVTNACVPCTTHDQCDEVACNLFTGTCFPSEADAIAHVGPGQELTTLAAAVTSFPAGIEGTVVVHQGTYNEAVTVDDDRTVAFLAARGDSPAWTLNGGGMPQLTVSAGSTVLMDGLQLSGNTNDLGLRVDGGRAWVDRSRIVANLGGGIVAENAAELVLRNCFVGSGALDVDVITLDASSLDMLYTTVGGGAVLGGRARALYCEGALTAEIRNSILVSADPMPEVECPGVISTNSAMEADVGPLNGTWFMSYVTGDFHFTPTGATTFAAVAQWKTGDPLTDIDGDLRPTDDGSPDHAGADVP